MWKPLIFLKIRCDCRALNGPFDYPDDEIERRTLTINHPTLVLNSPPTVWNGLLIPYNTTIVLGLAAGNVSGNMGSSGENFAQVYQEIEDPDDDHRMSGTIDVP